MNSRIYRRLAVNSPDSPVISSEHASSLEVTHVLIHPDSGRGCVSIGIGWGGVGGGVGDGARRTGVPFTISSRARARACNSVTHAHTNKYSPHLSVFGNAKWVGG